MNIALEETALTLYDVPFSHNTNVTDRRQTDGQNIVP